MTATCETCGQPAKRPRVLCTCGHPRTSHHVTDTGKLTYCSSYAPAGPCQCERFTDASGAAVTPPGGAG